MLRSILRRAVVFLGAGATAVVWSGCTATQQTEYVTGVSTQVNVPRDLRAIRIAVSVGGFTQFCQAYRVFDGKVQLPRSLGTFATADKTQVLTYSIAGYDNTLPEGSEFGLDECIEGRLNVGQGDVRILRRSRQPYIQDEIKFLPLPLRYSCFDNTKCNDQPEKTCKAGRCVDAGIDANKLPRYTDDLADGQGGACFQVNDRGVAPDIRFGCFTPGNTVPAVTVDTATCTFAIPNTPSAPPLQKGVPPETIPLKSLGEGLNVEITYDGGLTKEVLDKDMEEGFFVPDPAKPQQFRLAAGLCDLYNGLDTTDPDPSKWTPTEHRITSIRVSASCQSKGPYQPLCAEDQITSMGPGVDTPTKCGAQELRPARAALVILTDDTKNNELFYKAAEQNTLNLPLTDPSFSRTDASLFLYPGATGCAPKTPDVPLTIARTAQGVIAARFKAVVPTVPGKSPTLVTNLDGALRDAYALLGGLPPNDYYRRAVFVLGNRDFEANACGTGFANPAAQAADARAKSNIQTYVAMLARDSLGPIIAEPGKDTIYGQANTLAIAGGTGRAFDARNDNLREANDAFRRVVEDLGTCVYDTPDAVVAADTELSYSDPVAFPNAVPIKIPANPGCNAEGKDDDGWGIDASNPRRIRVCGKSCTDYRAVLTKAAAYANAFEPIKPTPPVPIFRFKKGCGPL